MPVGLFLRRVWPASKWRVVIATAVITLLAMGVVWGSTFYWLTLNRTERIDSTKENLARLTETIDEHVDGQLRSASTILRTVETWLTFHPNSDLRQDSEFLALAHSAGAGRPGFAGIRLILADGASLGRGDNGGKPSIPYTNQAFVLEALAATPGQISLGEAVRPAVGAHRLLPLALRLPLRADEVALLVTAIDLDELAETFERVRPSAAGAVSMLRADRKLLIRVPDQEPQSSDAFGHAAIFSTQLPEAPSGVFENAISPFDGHLRIVSYRTLPDFPVIVAVSTGMTEVLTGWDRELYFSSAFATALSAAFIVLALWVVRLLGSGHDQATELAESRRVLIKAQTLAQLGSYRRVFATQEMVWSVEACRILGYPPGMAPSSVERYLALVHPDDLGLIGDSLRAVQEGRSYSYDFRIVDAHGEVRHLHAMGTPEFDSGGTPMAVDGIIQDITDRKQMEQALRDARDAAERGSRAKSEFLANMSHELRTPLNAIIGFSEVMLAELFGPLGQPRYVEYARDMHHSGHHLLTIINALLDVAKIEAGQMELDERSIKPASLIDDCLPFVREKVATGHLVLKLDVAADLPELCLDPVRMRQVLLNLLSNAAKFTAPGGSITISAGRSAAGGGALAIADTGIGMNEDEINVARQPFRQVDNALSRRYEGTGLGLPLAQRLTELHGGVLGIASVPGQGTTVTILLPPERVLG